MKAFLVFVAAVILMGALFIGYTYHKLTYQPEYFKSAELTDVSSINTKALQTLQRLNEDLQNTGYARLSGEDIMSLSLSQLQQQTDLDLSSLIKKSKSEIKEGRFRGEAIVSLNMLSSQQIPQQAMKYVDTFLKYVPESMQEEVYIAVQSRPVKRNGKLYFAEDAVVYVGDFRMPVPESDARDLKIDFEQPGQLPISDIIVNETYIELRK